MQDSANAVSLHEANHLLCPKIPALVAISFAKYSSMVKLGNASLVWFNVPSYVSQSQCGMRVL